MGMRYTLGLDMGSTSIGWSVIKLNDSDQPVELLDMGVRIFGDGRNEKDKMPLSVKRREKRAARRRLDRHKLRRSDLLKALVKHGLMPKDQDARQALVHIDPYEARANAAHGPVSPEKLGRAVFHLHQRRGFKSNRLADSGDDAEVTGMKQGISSLRERLGSKTLGQFLYERHKNGQAVRMRPEASAGGKHEWDFYADRQMYMDEYDTLMSVQLPHQPSLTKEAVAEIREIIFRQRPLRQPEPGWCALLHAERRMPLADPLYQRFRIYQEVNNLSVERLGKPDQRLDEADKRKLSDCLLNTFEGVNKQGLLTWAKIKKLLEIPRTDNFNLAKAGRKGLACDRTSFQLSNESLFGPAWFSIPASQQAAIVERLLFEPDRSALATWLEDSADVSSSLAKRLSKVALPKGYGRLSRKAVELVMPGLEAGLTYDKACAQAGIDHSDRHTGEIYDQGDLPYYGEVLEHHALGGDHQLAAAADPEGYYGKINNPTVHIALNQLRKIINALYRRYRAAPQYIHVELARDLKLPPDKVREIERKQTRNRELNEKIDTELRRLGQQVNHENRMRYKLWQDLAEAPDRRVCPFTGDVIPLSRLFTEEFEVEHLIPFSRSFDDGRANKVVCTRRANRAKGNRTPFEAFGGSPAGFNWNDILARADNLHPSKSWRFQPDAMERLTGDQETILARMLTDTQYMSRIAREYLTYVLDDPARVIVTPGRLTAKLRHHWGLNSLISSEAVKDRGDHRHHAVDALVVACTSRRTLQKVSTAAARAEEKQLSRTIETLPPPFPTFSLPQAQQLVDKMVISYKPDSSWPGKNRGNDTTKGQLHEETNWGMIGPGEKPGFSIYATRVPLHSVAPASKSIAEIANERIRNDLLAAFVTGLKGKAWQAFLDNYAKEQGVRRVRIHREKSDAAMIPIKNKAGENYRYVQGGSYHCIDIWTPGKGKKAGRWQACPIKLFDAHQTSNSMPPWRKDDPTAKRIMRLHINDMVVHERNGKYQVTRVKKIDGSLGRVVLRDHRVAKEPGNKLSWTASANQLQLCKARRVWVDPLGRIHDAGAHTGR